MIIIIIIIIILSINNTNQSIGGERQKVSIARALMKDPTLILCDEVTSAVDAFAERDIVNSLRQVSKFLPPLYFSSLRSHVFRVYIATGNRESHNPHSSPQAVFYPTLRQDPRYGSRSHH